MEHRRDPTEQRMADMHRRIAARIRRDPDVIADSKVRLVRLMKQEPPPPDPVLQEWLDLLLMASPDQIADFIESGTPRAAPPDLQPAALARPMNRGVLDELLQALLADPRRRTASAVAYSKRVDMAA